jgi:hypothetical protein
MDRTEYEKLVEKEKPTNIIHLAALLSATAEE